MEIAFYSAGTIAVIATLKMLFSHDPVHGLLYLVISLLSVAVIYFAVGAPFAGVLEMIVYAGAIMVLFVFVVMMLNLGEATIAMEKAWLQPRAWVLPVILSSLLLGLMVSFLANTQPHLIGTDVSIKQVGIALYGPYILAVELASLILLAALVIAFHLGRRDEDAEGKTQ
ncbi:MAG: NADH-quinone oxidoreductase subunit J [Gammaproteobacteria bacterium]|nr:NADH-quinone oxidoreductase subunit J [Gammaproteobacteria bacterium]